MKLGIMQPYFFPYIGYFQLINSVDQWVVFDTPQYIRKGWVNRNRILHPDKGPTYVTVPVHKQPLNTPISETTINNDERWKLKLLGQLEACYRKKAPSFKPVFDLVRQSVEPDDALLNDLLTRSLQLTCEYLEIPFSYQLASTLDLADAAHAGQWALLISERLGADEYINPIGGKEIFREPEFSAKNIKLSFLQPGLHPYEQPAESFESALSIIDVMMWNPVQVIRDKLLDCRIIPASDCT